MDHQQQEPEQPLDQDQESWLTSLVLMQSDIAARMHLQDRRQEGQDNGQDDSVSDIVKKLDPKLLVRGLSSPFPPLLIRITTYPILFFLSLLMSLLVPALDRNCWRLSV